MKGKSSKSSKSGRSSGNDRETAKVTSSHKASEAAVAERDPRTLLGQILVELGYVTVYQLDEALHAQRTERASKKARNPEEEQKPLGQIMLELGYCTPNQLIRAIQVQSDYRRAAARLRDDR